MNVVRIGGPFSRSLLADCFADAEAEVLKLRKLVVVKYCDCRRMTTTLPLEPVMHAAKCQYRKVMS